MSVQQLIPVVGEDVDTNFGNWQCSLMRIDTTGQSWICVYLCQYFGSPYREFEMRRQFARTPPRDQCLDPRKLWRSCPDVDWLATALNDGIVKPP